MTPRSPPDYVHFMAKLYFRHGTMGSAKTMNLLAVAHNYQAQGKKAVMVKPKLDSRFGANTIRSRSGLEKDAHILVEPDSVLNTAEIENASCILVDEAQFLSVKLVDQLRAISRDMDIPVICYGLRTDFKTGLFEGSRRLLEVADSIEEVKTTCYYCNRKAIFNMKLLNGKPTLAGPTIDLGDEEKYLPTCATCYHGKLAHAE
ncbi:MAG: thymidine kinase [Bdellovibrionia bacterium]